MKELLFTWLILHSFYIFSHADVCTWENCPKWNNSLINIHFVPHTHDDMGWLKTVDDYYTGAHMDIVKVGVQYIIDTVIDNLNKDPSRKFSYCETGFLNRWMEDNPTLVNQTLGKFIQNGQLEIIGGGWTQPDEAATHYIELIDMYSLGLNILDKNFGRCGHPKVAWQIDPFGHSREHANLVKMLGYEALYFWRMHYLERAIRGQNKALEFNWQTSDDNSNTIFAGAFFGDYCAPPTFNFDDHDDPIVDNPMFEDVNIDERLTNFMNFIQTRVPQQMHNHFLVLMGCDFAYSNANMWYKNIDKLIYNLNKNYSNVTAFYSTPTCYTQAVQQLNLTWPKKTTDFFPYAYTGNPYTYQGNHSYWTGYFTSKPAMKGLVRKSSSLLQLTRQLNAFAPTSWSDQISKQINILERAVGTSMHHDAITGTSKEAVTQDYEYRMLKGWTNAELVINSAMPTISQRVKQNNEGFPVQTICRNINESECLLTKNTTQFTVTVHNGNGQNFINYVKIPIYNNGNGISVTDDQGNRVTNQVVTVFNNSGQINNLNIAPNELVFLANVKPFGYRTYFIANAGSKDEEKEPTIQLDSTINNGLVQITFDSNGYLSSITDLTKNITYPIRQEFLYYIGYPVSDQPSGAYVFRPLNNTPISISGTIQLTTVSGPVVNEVRQTVSPYVSQTIRLLPNKTYVEFEWTIGPIPTADNNSKEIISQYRFSNLQTNGTFLTDANGRQLMKRVRNYQADYQYDDSEHVSGNYYPINSRIVVSDGTTLMAVLTDRSHGGGSINDGQLEIMLHRRDLYDDHFGVGEPLNEPGSDGRGLVVRGKHWLLVGSAADVTQRHRTLAYELFHDPVLTFSPLSSDVNTYQNKYATSYSGLSQPLPSNINIMTLKQHDASSVLLRLEHIFQTNEDPNLSKPASIDLSKLFADLNITQVVELGLAGTSVVNTLNSTVVTLNPMDIKTYQLLVIYQNDQGSTPGTTTVPKSATRLMEKISFAQIFITLILMFLTNHLF